MNPRRDFGPQVKWFSNTTGAGAIGLSRRVRGWIERDKGELFRAGYRKARRIFAPRSMPFAQAVHIELTNHCNLECPMCPQPTMERKKGVMSGELFRQIIGQLRPHRFLLEGVALMGLGEPLIHRELEEFSQVAKSAGLPNLYTSTNAALLDEKRCASILEKGRLDRILFSVDGIDKQTFEQIRKGANFEQVYANIETFLEMKKKRGRGPVATLQILLMEQTLGQLEEFCDYWVPRLGPKDEILIKEVDTFGGLVADRRLDADRQPQMRTPCRQLWKDLSISWDGRVTVCCKDVYYKLAVGALPQDDLVELWRGEKWNRIRQQHMNGVYTMDPCHNCREWYL